MKTHRLEEIKVWEKAIHLAEEIYRITNSFPDEEKFGLISQMRKASVSIASNIAEGAGRNTNGEFDHFLGIAQGSSYELLTQISIAVRLNFLSNKDFDLTKYKIEEVQKMIYGFRKNLKLSHV